MPIGVAVSGKQSCEIAGELGDVMIAVEPKPELGEMFDAAGGAGKPRIGQMPISFGTDKDAAVTRAHTLFRWFGLGWKVNAELPGPPAFDAASQFVRRGGRRGAHPVRRRRRRRPRGREGVRRRRASPTWRSSRSAATSRSRSSSGAEQTLMPAWREAFGD